MKVHHNPWVTSLLLLAVLAAFSLPAFAADPPPPNNPPPNGRPHRRPKPPKPPKPPKGSKLVDEPAEEGI